MNHKYSVYKKDYFSNKKMFWYEDFIRSNKVNEATKAIFQLTKLFNVKNKNILEVGFGKGILASLLIKEGANYFGIDYSKFALSELKKTIEIKCSDAKYNAIIGSLTEIDKLYSNVKFDMIVFQSTLEHVYLEDIEIFFNKILFLLNPCAKIIIGNAQYPTGLHLPGNKNVGSHVTNVNIYFINALTEEINPYFDQLLHIKGYFVFERNNNTEFCKKINLINSKSIEYIEFNKNKYYLKNQRKLYLRKHFLRRPIQLLKRILELDQYA